VLNTTEMSTADFVKFRDANLRAADRVDAIQQVVGKQNLSTIAANRLAESLLGDTIYSNVMLVGYAWQSGLLPLSLDAMLRAIELNGVAVEQNKQAFGWGRLAAAEPQFVQSMISDPQQNTKGSESLDEMIDRRAKFLVDYQDEALSNRFTDLVDEVAQAETALGRANKPALTEAVVRSYFKTLAYKDEYEVARLHTQSGFTDQLKQRYGKGARLRFHLAPPLLSSGVDARGRPRKREFGAWIIPAFRLLARFRKLRGTRLDLFGRTAERRMERALIGEFEDNVEILLQHLSSDNIELATEIVKEYLEIRGYGPVKEEAARNARARIESKLAGYRQVTSRAA
jgi:indolepyruvate ferredoxin oxidoreductase